MSKEQLRKLEQLATEPSHHGKWSEFCIKEGLSRDSVFHWRKKLGYLGRKASND